ncbi:hypothetical protein E4L68_33640, partial [Burkholderia pseudomallei]|nr:hypothetical protein [Burkholderia pseudomallei]
FMSPACGAAAVRAARVARGGPAAAATCAARRPRKAAAARGADACAGARVRAPAVRYRLIGL